MPTVLQHRRGTATQNDAFTGAAGELTIDLTNDTIRVHDGSTQGGKRLATKTEADAALSAAAGLDSAKAIALIDSAYVLARAPAQTLGTDFVDSAEARKTISVTDAGGDGSLSYNNSTGVLTYTGPSASEVRAHITAGEGIDISSGEISGEDATTSNKGIASFATANFTVASGAVSLKTDGINDTHIDFGTGTNQVSTADLPEQTNLYFTDGRAKSAAVADAINNGTTDVAPSQNAVFDALALKLNASAVPTLSTDFIDSAEAIKLIDSSYVQARQSGGEITIQEEGSSLSTAATTLNFVGSGVTATGSGTTKTITISGGGGSGTVDSSAVIALIDSAYVLARAPAQDFLDSAEAIALIDSAYVQARQSATGGTDPIFKTIAVAGQSSIVADTTTDTLTVVGSTGITVTTTAGTDTLTLATTDGDIVHDNLSGFVANEHIDHTSVSIATGTGLSGGGTIASTRTLKIDSSDLAGLYSKVIVHDNTNGFVANEHIDHTSVSLIAGKGLSGGGTIAADRTIDIDSANVRGMFSGGTGITYNSGTGAITTTDGDIVHDNLSGFVANEHIDHSGVSIIAGNGLSGGGTIASSRTINIDSANIDVMIDSNLAGSSVLINGNGSTGGITLSDGLIDIRTGTGAVSKIKFYCETNNAHFQTLQAQPHSAGSSGVIVLPVDSGTLALTSQIPTLGTDFVDSAQTNILIDARDTHDSAAVKGQIDSAVPALIDSSYVQARQAAGSGITIQEEGSSLSTLGTTLNFVGSTVTASGTGATKTITISGSGGGGLDSALTTQLIDSSYVSNRALGGLGQNEFLYTATNNQTTFSGNDKKGNSLAYTADRIFVHLNGVLLNDSDDYTASNGTSVVLTTGATTNDELRVSAFGIATPPVTTGKAIAMAIVFGG